ncbi:putative transposase [Paraburkholderia sp. BL8N3]|nr:RNA-guided endonuclease TnpB family protein [Paraburkholderia sp. BL8N3]TCK33521.1 putative transposase [Paraburkholderia sp. BL8N3]
MEILVAFKYELMPTGQQARSMRRFAGSCRFVFNKALALQKERYESGEKKLGYAGLCKQLTEWRNAGGIPWLKDSPIHPAQQALKDLELAYSNFFAKRADFPRFKKKGIRDSFRYPDPKQIKLERENGRIFLPKLGWIRYRNSRLAVGTLRNVTVSSNGSKWFVSVLMRREVEQPRPQGPSIGIAVGVACFATLSDGALLTPLNSFKKHEQRLAKYQRRMARKTKFSNNWKKAKDRVQRIHSSIANVRKDFLHKASTQISKNHAIVCIDDLQVRNISKSASETVEAAGGRVAQKKGWNKAVLDRGWGEFRRQLEYKTRRKGGEFVAVPSAYTSQTCPCCGHMSRKNCRTRARFACVSCGYENDTDHVGAVNILAAGHAVLACGEPVLSGRSGKQEPIEATAQSIA